MKTVDSGIFPHGIFQATEGHRRRKSCSTLLWIPQQLSKTTYISYFSGLVNKIFDRNKEGRKSFCLIVTMHHHKQGMVEFLASGIRGWVLHNMVNKEVETKIRTRSGYLLQRPVLSDPLPPFRYHLLNNNQFAGGIFQIHATLVNPNRVM